MDSISSIGGAGHVSDAGAAAPVKHHHKTHGRKVSHKKEITKLEGKVKEELDFLKGHLHTNAGIHAFQHRDGHISLRLKTVTPATSSMAQALPRDVTNLLGQYLDPTEKRVAATGMPEMRGGLNVQALPSPKGFSRIAKENLAIIDRDWESEGISNQRMATVTQTEFEAWVIVSADGRIKEMMDPWSHPPKPTGEPGDVVVKFKMVDRFKDLDKETQKMLDASSKLIPQVATLKANDNKPVWDIEGLEKISNPTVQASLSLTLDYLNVKAANKSLKVK